MSILIVLTALRDINKNEENTILANSEPMQLIEERLEALVWNRKFVA